MDNIPRRYRRFQLTCPREAGKLPGCLRLLTQANKTKYLLLFVPLAFILQFTLQF